MSVTDRISGLMIQDQRRIRRRLGRQRGHDLERLIAAAEQRVAARIATVPPISYPAELPIAERRQDLLDAIAGNQVVIVAGETGSGKSTQLPKLCLEAGKGVRGMIGHTQPRRIAARTIAERIAEELDVPLGSAVGYTVRFTDRVSDSTLVKVMTDGILLAELHRDRALARYDTIILDEAHERSLNIDFLLGYLKQLLPRRPDLTLIITSATIDTERFAEHFDGAPVVEVSGRSYPIEILWRPPADDVDEIQAICNAVDDLDGSGDVLVFLSGEREIRDTADALSTSVRPGTEIVPLFARLSSADQHKVFEPHTGRRIVLATNVAETSLTVPGIRAVIDPGSARISRFNRRTKVQRLPIEPVSQASANQRAGRCGRVGPGVCLRLYSEEDFDARPAFTDPEIARTNLAAVILQMAALDLGDVAEFPFVDPPDLRSINDGIALLEELGALEERHRLTPIGRKLAALPVDPRLGRMLLEASAQGSLTELLVIASGLSIQDPRERPSDAPESAAQSHARFRDKESDFLSILHLWEHLRARQDELSSNQFRKLCRAEYFNYLRVREWQDLHGQLRRAADDLGLVRNATPAPPDRIHIAVLAGLLSHVGHRDPVAPEYRGARGSRFSIAGASTLAKRQPRWVMAAELVETNRLWARTIARVEPSWIERAGAHLVRRSYGDPRWDVGRATAVTDERVTLYGLTLVAGRQLDYVRVDLVEARALFIENALVAGDWRADHDFIAHNQAVIEDVRALEHRARRALLASDEALFAFYDARIPTDVTSARTFDRWWRRAPQDVLDMAAADAMDATAPGLDDFPDAYLGFPLHYVWEPGAEDDGVSVEVPLAALPLLPDDDFAWNVTGYRPALVESLIRSLPKAVRRQFVPAGEFARRFLEIAAPHQGGLIEQLERLLPELSGESMVAGEWRLEAVPAYLRMGFLVVGDDDRVVAYGRNLDDLRASLRTEIRGALARATAVPERSRQRAWTFGDLPRVAHGTVQGLPVRGYPAIVDEGDAVGIRVMATPGEQVGAMWAGTRRLLTLAAAVSTKDVQRKLPTATRLAVAKWPDVLDDCITAAIDRVLESAGGPVWTEADWTGLRRHMDDALLDTAVAVATFSAKIIATADGIERRLDGMTASALQPAVEDITVQVARLVHPRFVIATGASRLPDVLRYLRAIERRLDTMTTDLVRDRQRMARIVPLEEAARRAGDDEIRWMVEELRVSLFAQALGTAGSISEKRIRRAIEARLDQRPAVAAAKNW